MALDRIGRLVDDPARDGRAEVWFHERTEFGWVILDENRAIVAAVPDAAHEREDDAIRVASAANCATTTSPSRRASGGSSASLDARRPAP